MSSASTDAPLSERLRAGVQRQRTLLATLQEQYEEREQARRQQIAAQKEAIALLISHHDMLSEAEEIASMTLQEIAVLTTKTEQDDPSTILAAIRQVALGTLRQVVAGFQKEGNEHWAAEWLTKQ